MLQRCFSKRCLSTTTTMVYGKCASFFQQQQRRQLFSTTPCRIQQLQQLQTDTLVQQEAPIPLVMDKRFKSQLRRMLQDMFAARAFQLACQHEHQLDKKYYTLASEKFATHFFQHLLQLPEVQHSLATINKQQWQQQVLQPMFITCATHWYKHEIAKKQELKAIADMRAPHEWYADARMLKRSVIFHCMLNVIYCLLIYILGGPTNSGKTYQAFTDLMQSKSGIYLAPLRLLAAEAYIKMKQAGVPCHLITGDHKLLHEPSDACMHTAATMEMLQTSHVYDTCVIDEIQMIQDEERGAAWTRALLGVRAQTVHICGEARALPIVQSLLQETGDTLQVRNYERLTPLSVMQQSIEELQHGKRKSSSSSSNNKTVYQPGDCLICFSRREVFQWKSFIEATTPYKVSVVYGGLPPHIRIQQAALFNDPSSPYDILVGTDAIGMGLNLNIGRIIFTSMSKFDGTDTVPLTVSQVKQIAGRAGRFNSAYPHGYVTTYHANDLHYLHKCMLPRQFKTDTSMVASNEELIEQAGLAPTRELIEEFASRYDENVKLSQILRQLEQWTRLDHKQYFLCPLDDQKVLADVIHSVKTLSFQERYTFIQTPLNAEDDTSKQVFLQYVLEYAQGNKDIPTIVQVPQTMPKTLDQLKYMEEIYKLLEAYSWLSYRFDAFSRSEEAEKKKSLCRKWIELSLKHSNSLLGEYRQARQEQGKLKKMKREQEQTFRKRIVKLSKYHA